MKNYDLFLRIVKPYEIQRERVTQDRGCFSSLFSCFDSDTPAPARAPVQDRLTPDQRAFIDGMKHVAFKITRGEQVHPSDFRGNVQVVRRRAAGERDPLLANRVTDSNLSRENESRTLDQLKPFIDFIPVMANAESRENVFKLFLNAVYHYLNELEEADTFSTELMRNFERNYNFVVSDEIAQGDDAINCLELIKKAIKTYISLQKSADARNSSRVSTGEHQAGNGGSQAGAGALSSTGALPTSPAALVDEYDAGSLGTSYQYQRAAKK